MPVHCHGIHHHHGLRNIVREHHHAVRQQPVCMSLAVQEGFEVSAVVLELGELL